MQSTTTQRELYSFAVLAGAQTPNTGVNTVFKLTGYDAVAVTPTPIVLVQPKQVYLSGNLNSSGNYIQLDIRKQSDSSLVATWVLEDATQAAALFPSGFNTFCTTIVSAFQNSL